MRSMDYLLLIAMFIPSNLAAESWAQAATDTAVYSVSYIEVLPASKQAAIAELKRYRDMSRKDEGYVQFELFEQIGRPGHFVILESFASQKAFDVHAMGGLTNQLISKLQAIRSSDYDQRPYKNLTVGSARSVDARAIYVISHVDVGGPQGDAPGSLKRLAEASRKDDGSLRFDVLQHTMRANHFTVIEAWQSQKALDAHAAAAHTKQYRDELHPILGSPLDERLYKIVE